jgi:hypothetical protein
VSSWLSIVLPFYPQHLAAIELPKLIASSGENVKHSSFLYCDPMGRIYHADRPKEKCDSGESAGHRSDPRLRTTNVRNRLKRAEDSQFSVPLQGQENKTHFLALHVL